MGARLPDLESLVNAGIDPKTGLPYKAISEDNFPLKNEIKKALRIVDEQDAINRYVFRNLPEGLNSQLIERIVYYKGQGILFYMPRDSKFYFLPYALNGTIDVYGRFTSVTPLPFNGQAASSKDNEQPKAWITGLTRFPVYDIKLDLKTEDLETSCVILSDYSNQLSQTNIPRQIIQDPILDTMAECYPFMRTALINGTGINGIRVNDQDSYGQVDLANRSIAKAALTGKPFLPIVSQIEFQELSNSDTSKAEEYLIAMQSLDNFRLSLYGLQNGGLFQKKSHMLEAEQDMNTSTSNLVFQDGLTIRQRFCDICNSIWGLDMYVEAAESAINNDSDLDGDYMDNSDSEEAQEEAINEQPTE